MAAADIDKIARAAGDRPAGWQTVYGYQFQAWLGRARFHIFHREDPGAAFHNHPWAFWTFPLVAYVEDVERAGVVTREIVPAFWPTWRAAEHTHRIIGPWSGAIVAGLPQVAAGKIVTLVWRGRVERAWQYVIVAADRVHSLPWRRYLAIADRHPRAEITRDGGMVSAPAKETGS